MPRIVLRLNNVLVSDKQHEENREYLRVTHEEAHKRMLAARALEIACFLEAAKVGNND